MDSTYKFSLVMLKKYFSLVLLVNYVKTIVQIDRDELDTAHGYTQCTGFDRTTGWFSKCTCKPKYTTIMSVQEEEYNCMTPKEVECDYRLEGNEQTFLIKDGSVNAQIIPIEDTNAKTNGLTISNLSTWNYDGYIGSWRDITVETNDFFEIKDGPLTNLAISRIDMKVWSGHLVKVDFVNNSCLLVKMKGSITYPFDEGEFRKIFAKPPTTTVSTKTTSASSTKPVGSKTTTTSGGGESSTTVPSKTTQRPSTTRTGSPRVTSTTGKLTSTAVSTTIAGPQPFSGPNPYTAAYVSIPIIIIILAAVAGVFVYRRRKASEKDCSDSGSVSKAKNIYPDISMVNNAYAPEVYKNNMFIEPADTCASSDSLPPSYSQANIAANTDTANTGQDPLSGPCNNSVENPVYMCYAESLSDSDKDSKDEYVDVDIDEDKRTTTNDDAR